MNQECGGEQKRQQKEAYRRGCNKVKGWRVGGVEVVAE